ncbi:AMP-binding protein [Pseudohaliea sp.]|uniref:class I adenylate-forming enzyme family protein n=1 Tax=Pseudohaliea sp. TaxID=2740289 RepID=UPI0032ED1D0C
MQDILTEVAGRRGDAPALVTDDLEAHYCEWSFRELEDNANRIARVLCNLGIRGGENILWSGPNSVWAVAIINAARKLGGVSVALNYQLAPEEALYIANHSDARCILFDQEAAPLLARIQDRFENIQHRLYYGAGDAGPGERLQALIRGVHAAPLPPPEDHGGGTLTYTSGTTGRPKGVIRPPFDPAANPWLDDIAYEPGDVYITSGPVYHSGPRTFLEAATKSGCLAVIQRKFNAENWLRLVSKYGVTHSFAAPTPIRRICQLPPEVLARYSTESVRVLIANAAPWSQALKLSYLEHFPKHSLYESYGSTELGTTTLLYPEEQLVKVGSCGRAVKGIELRLYDEAGQQILAPNTPGELYARGHGVFESYYKDSDSYLRCHRDGFQTVGDVAYLDEEGYVYICDRKQDMIISGGVNLYPAEIESAIEQHPDVLDVAVVARPNEEWGESPHAVVVIREGGSMDAEELDQFLRDRLAAFKIPRSMTVVDAIPRNASGKILKKQIRDELEQQVAPS